MMKVILIIAVLVSACYAHSWMACSDYRPTTTQNSKVYDASACKGFPRNWQTYSGSQFGEDRGYNFQGTGCGNQNARGSPVSAAYSTTYPMAQWVVGSTVCLAWPSKNHVAAKTTNAFIPDNGMKLFRSTKPDTSVDPAQSEFSSNVVQIFGPHVNGQIDYKGFQNCSGFDENNDKALCLGCFTVPNLTPGVYVMQWYWIFNAGTDPYTTCFDVAVAASGTQVTNACTGVVCQNGGTCNNGVCTCVNGFTGSFCTVPAGQTAQPGSTQNPAFPSGVDSVEDINWPTSLKNFNSFRVQVKYNSGGNRAIVVDVLKLPNYDFYGKGVTFVTASSGIINVDITPQNNPAFGTNYVLKAWIVDKSFYDQNPALAYTQELDLVIKPITFDPNASSSSVSLFFSYFILLSVFVISAFLF